MVTESNDYLAGLSDPSAEPANSSKVVSKAQAPSHRTKVPAPSHRRRTDSAPIFSDSLEHDDDVFGFGDEEVNTMEAPNATGQTAIVESPQRSKRLVWLGAFFAIILAVGFFAKLWIDKQLDPSGDPRTTAIDIQIPQGSSSGEIGDILEQNEIIPSSRAFGYYTKYKNLNNFQAGDYVLNENMSVYEAIAVLDAGPADPESPNFSVNEGLWVSEALLEIEKDVPGVTVADLEAVLASDSITPKYRPEGITSWEGLLFPAKYDFAEGTTAREVISLMNNKFNDVATEVGLDDPEKLRGYTPYEIIIIASLIEAEAALDADRPKVASVIYNRLEGRDNGQTGRLLQVDAALFYGLGTRDINEMVKNLESDNPYNLRNREGLPPTPIAFPGKASLEAALNPAETDFLFYVLKDKQGNHLFTADVGEFNRQKNKSINEGVFKN